MVANPRAVRHFAQAMMQRSKNDQLDVVVLLEFAARMPFSPWVRPQENALALWAIARRLQALTRLCTAEKNRAHAMGLSAAIPAIVRRDIARSLQFHQRAMKKLRQQALQCIAADAQLQQRYQLLRSIPGADVAEVDAGCCGMAGSFGFEAEHYELSMNIGELRLFPAIRAEAADVIIAATGVSCRQQIAHGTGRPARHPLEIVQQALNA